jgi:hypothetical protein
MGAWFTLLLPLRRMRDRLFSTLSKFAPATLPQREARCFHFFGEEGLLRSYARVGFET